MRNITLLIILIQVAFASYGQDTTPPEITLSGDNPQTVQRDTSGLTTYSDPGATAFDNVDGDITGSITVTTTVPVDITTVGTYTVTYNVQDAAGNDAIEVTRTVNVVDTTAPVITLIGDNPQTVERDTSGSTYSDPGATAEDPRGDGTISGSIVVTGTVDITSVGTYTLNYNVSDATGNAATTVVRTVNVVDTTVPVISLNGSATITIERGSAYTETVSANDPNGDGDITGSISITGTVDNTTVGTYNLLYDVADSAGNNAVQVSRTVTVEDTTIPVITLTDSNPQTIEVHNAYTELGATANDPNGDGDITGSIVINSSAVNTAVVASYTVTYDVDDSASNSAVQVTRTVNVVDTTAPVITLAGDNPQIVEINTAYVEAGIASAIDNYDGDVSGGVTIDASALNTAAVGRYNVIYSVTDANVNTGTATREVHVMDHVPHAFDDSISVSVNSTDNTIDVLANDCFGLKGANTTHPLTLENGKSSIFTVNGGSIVINDNGTTGDLSDDIIKYTPSSGFTGTDTFTYSITDTAGVADTATVTITVTGTAQPSTPSAVNDDLGTVVFAGSSAHRINVLANDSAGADGYIDGGLTFTNGTINSASANGGSISVDDNGTSTTGDDTILYTPADGFSGADTFDYTITDATGDASTATVTITVEVEDLGFLPDTATVDQDSSDNIIDVMANDTDDATFGLTDTRFLIESVDHLTGTTAQGGTVALETYSTADTSDDVILYTPPAGFVGIDTFNYVPGNLSHRDKLVQVTVTVLEVITVNGTPTADDDTANATQNGSAVDIDVTDNDDYGTDGPNTSHPLTFANGTTTSASDNGASIVVNNNNTSGVYTDDYIVYTPTSSFTGTDTFTYTITDANGDAASATVTVTVGASGQVFVPTANDDAVSVFTNTTSNIIDVLGNDESGADGYIDNGLTMTNGTLFSASTNGGAISIDNKGTGDVSDDEFFYTPPTGFSGTDTFQYTITDATGDADTATVTVTVDVVTNAPTAGDDTVSVVVDSSNNVINMLTNDSFGTDGPSSPPVSFSAGLITNGFYITTITTAQGGTAVLTNNDSEIHYTPASGFTGTDSFTYYIYDDNGDRDGAIVTVTVTETPVVNGTPTADDDTANATQNGSAVDIDVTDNDDYGTDGPNTSHPLTFANGTTTSASDNGASIEVVSGNVRYTPSATFSGTDTFTYTITDANGDAASATVTVTVTGSGEVYVPTADDDTASFDQNSSTNSINVLGNDDVGADGLISGHGLRLQGGLSQRYTANGGYMVVNDGGTANDSSDDTIDYTPAAGFTGIDTFTYTITDATGDSSTATVTVTVTVPKGTTSEANNNFTNSFTIYPNPSRGLVNTQIESASATEALLYVVDVTGKVVYKNNLNLTQGLNTVSFTLARAQGVMFIRVIGKNENFGTKKIIFE